jgi:hypothetical protein
VTQHGTRRSRDRPVVVVHVGEPKTGTTFLQHLMWTNRAELHQHGVIYPGPRANAHWRASQDLREIKQAPDDPAPPFAGEWDRIVQKALKAPRAGVISHELLSAATPEQAARGLKSLESAEVHVVLTVRDIGSLIPAEWQETVKHRNARPWREWLDDVIDKESPRPDRRNFMFWLMHDTMPILESWSQGIPPENVHVITMPRDGSSTLLWERFATLLDIDPAIADTTRVRANASLGVPEIEMVRRLNERIPASYPDWSYIWFVKDTLAHGPLARRPKTGRLALPRERWDWALAQADELCTALSKSGFDIIGNLDELIPQFRDDATPEPANAQPEEMLDAALDSMTVLLKRMEELRAKGREAAPGAANQPPQSKLKAAIIEASETHRAVGALRVAYWRIRHIGRQLRAAAGRLAGAGRGAGK